MKKFLFILMLTASIVTNISADEYVVRHAPYSNEQSEYLLDRKFQNRDNSTYFGVMTRFGYSFSDNGYFSYGASLYYTFNSIIGITAGFDGYAGNIYIINQETQEVTQYDGQYKKMPMWDVRAGVTLGKYVALGAIYGRCRVCTGDQVIVHKYSEKLTPQLGKNGSFLGAFATVIAPISTHVALDFDLSYTNHTSFTLTAGLILRLKVK